MQGRDNMERRYYSLAELAEYTGISTYSLRRYMDTLGLPHFRVNRTILVRIDEFEKWMEAKRRLDNAEDACLEAMVDEVVKDFDL
jgi:excisionase family DNA binding protein